MQTFGSFALTSPTGPKITFLGLRKGHVLIGFVVAALIFCNYSSSAVWAQQAAWYPTSGVALVDELASEDVPVSFDPIVGQAPAEGGPVFLYCDADRDQRPTVDHDVAPVKYNQPVADGKAAPPSYLNPGQPASEQTGEKLPSPSYLDDGNEKLTIDQQLEQFSQRLDELEAAKIANEDATRTLIRRSFAERGSNITDAVVFGGTLETLTFWADDFTGASESNIQLDTAELDFEITVNPWVLGSLVFEFDDGRNVLFPTSEGDEVAVDRVNVRQAFITIGNTANYPLFATTGRDVVPFGISTGDPVADVLTIVDPLTVEVFEMREDFIMIGFEGPTCCPPPAATTPIPAPAPPRPMIFNPLVRHAATSLCSYCPCTPPAKPLPEYLPPPTCLTPFTGAVYFFNGDTINSGEDHIEHIGGTLGYRTRGMLPRFIPWSIDFDVDVTSSVFDSNFLGFEYRTFLGQIGYVPGMATHLKSNVGPFAFVVEWNGALHEAQFFDDSGSATPIRIQPEAWQVQVAYQFDWNRYVEVIGAQGTYVVVGYSESRDLAGVEKAIGDPPTLVTVGDVPEKRLNAGVGEWVLPGLRVAFEYSHVIDYGVDEGGTGNSADGVFMQVTYEW